MLQTVDSDAISIRGPESTLPCPRDWMRAHAPRAPEPTSVVCCAHFPLADSPCDDSVPPVPSSPSVRGSQISRNSFAGPCVAAAIVYGSTGPCRVLTALENIANHDGPYRKGNSSRGEV